MAEDRAAEKRQMILNSSSWIVARAKTFWSQAAPAELIAGSMNWMYAPPTATWHSGSTWSRGCPSEMNRETAAAAATEDRMCYILFYHYLPLHHFNVQPLQQQQNNIMSHWLLPWPVLSQTTCFIDNVQDKQKIVEDVWRRDSFQWTKTSN